VQWNDPQKRVAHLSLPIQVGQVYKHACTFQMANKKTRIGRILGPALALLLLCGIAAAEVPELLSLTDNTSNDFSVCKADPLVLSVRFEATRGNPVVDSDSNASAPNFLFSHLNPFDQAILVPSEQFLLHAVLRT
jgi:hypothetical protein